VPKKSRVRLVCLRVPCGEGVPEIRTPGLMSGDGKRGVAEWLKLPPPSSTLPKRTWARVQRSGLNDEVKLIAESTRWIFLLSISFAKTRSGVLNPSVN
jgi:hypothetical protein